MINDPRPIKMTDAMREQAQQDPRYARDYTDRRGTFQQMNTQIPKTDDNPNTPEDELESKLTKDLQHTLKLVPTSQRELFVFELARYLAKDRTNLITQLEAKKHTDYINDIHYVEDDEFNAGIDTAIEVLRGEL